jgi:chloramphenicol 3-O-phosphotransferase
VGELFATGRVLPGYDVWQVTVKLAKIAGKKRRSRSTRRTAGPAAQVPIEAGLGNDEMIESFA